ncbi:MAG: hypothetical protein R2830_16020 [Saprospiraceae bacterium]
MRHYLLLSFIASGLLMLPACNNDPKQQAFDQERLIGRWEIVSGYRNGKKTETLTGTFFQFAPDGTMKTNLTPTVTEEEYPYKLSGNTISQEGNPAIIYSIDTLTDSLLDLSMTINNFPFKVNLKKAPPREANGEGIMQ